MSDGYLVEFRIRPMPVGGDTKWATAIAEVVPILVGSDGRNRFKQRSRSFVLIDDAIAWAHTQMLELREEQKENINE